MDTKFGKKGRANNKSTDVTPGAAFVAAHSLEKETERERERERKCNQEAGKQRAK